MFVLIVLVQSDKKSEENTSKCFNFPEMKYKI